MGGAVAIILIASFMGEQRLTAYFSKLLRWKYARAAYADGRICNVEVLIQRPPTARDIAGSTDMDIIQP